MLTFALTELLGTPVFDTAGSRCGRVREVALIPQEDRARVAVLIIKTSAGDRLLPFVSVTSINGGIRTDSPATNWAKGDGAEGMLLLGRDLLDQQVIDVFGRKVVRVNDLDLLQELVANRPVLKVGSVDVGSRGAVRRLLKGVVPLVALRALLKQIPPRSIPWDFVDLIETDPARRVKLKISHERLAKLHPADIADIVEDLAPDEREAVFETLQQDVAAGQDRSDAGEPGLFEYVGHLGHFQVDPAHVHPAQECGISGHHPNHSVLAETPSRALPLITAICSW